MSGTLKPETAGDRDISETSPSTTAEDLWLVLRSDQWFSTRADFASQRTLGSVETFLSVTNAATSI